MTRMLRLLLALLATAALALTGCGGDDDDGGGDAASDSASDAAADDADEEGSDDVDIDDIEALSGDCLEAFAAFSNVAAGAGFAGADADLEESLEQFEAFADAAPDEIRDEMRILGEAYARFVEVMVETGFDPQSGEAPDEETMAALTEAMEPLGSEEVTAASEAVSRYFETECGGTGE